MPVTKTYETNVFSEGPASNTSADSSQFVGQSKSILPRQWLRELSAPIQAREGAGLSLKR